MKRYRVDFGYGRYYFEPNAQGEWVRFEDHEAIIQRQASAALAGMNAATAISSRQLALSRQARAESSPDALESERQANAKLTDEIERLRNDLTACQLERDGMRAALEKIVKHRLRGRKTQGALLAEAALDSSREPQDGPHAAQQYTK